MTSPEKNPKLETMKEKIKLTDSTQDILFKMSEGNPGALTVLLKMLAETKDIDPDNMLGGFGPILSLDTLNLYGSQIWMLYKDVCKESLVSTLAVLRGWQLGFTTKDQIHKAVENYGDGINVANLHLKVVEQLPLFASQNKDS